MSMPAAWRLTRRRLSGSGASAGFLRRVLDFFFFGFMALMGGDAPRPEPVWSKRESPKRDVPTRGAGTHQCHNHRELRSHANQRALGRHHWHYGYSLPGRIALLLA